MPTGEEVMHDKSLMIIDAIKKLVLEPSDILVLKVNTPCSLTELQMLWTSIEDVIESDRIIILPHDVDMTVIKKSEVNAN